MMKYERQPICREPIFILGNPRSGTTMFRLMLTSHKNIVIPPECGFAVWLYPRYRHWRQGWDSKICRAFVREVSKSRKFETWNLTPGQLSDFIMECKPNSYMQAVSLVYELYGTSQKRVFSRWGDKNNFYVDYLPTLRAMFPRAFYVHLVRDGRNVACSYIGLSQRHIDSEYVPRLPSNIGEIATEWRSNVNRIYKMFHGDRSIRFYEIRFEDVVSNTEGSLSKLCRWLGEDYDPAMAHFYRLNERNRLEPKEFLQWKAKTLKPPIIEEVDRYRNELSIDDRRRFEAVAGEELMRYHYPLF